MREEPRRLVFARIIKLVFIALIPIGCLVSAKYAGLGLSGQFADWAIAVALGWAAITLISAIDPMYRAKLNDIRNIVSIVRGKGSYTYSTE
jgi:hypothetical protein